MEDRTHDGSLGGHFAADGATQCQPLCRHTPARSCSAIATAPRGRAVTGTVCPSPNADQGVPQHEVAAHRHVPGSVACKVTRTHTNHHSDHGPPLSSRSWDSELFDLARYAAVIERLRVRAAASPSLRASAPIDARVSLDWVLRNHERVVDAIVASIGARDFALGPHRETTIRMGGKARAVFIPSWPDRILLMVMASVIAERSEPLLSPRVFSFRKGRGAAAALHELAGFLRTGPRAAPCFVLRRDIDSYGDSIPRAAALATLARLPGFAQSPRCSRARRAGAGAAHRAGGGGAARRARGRASAFRRARRSCRPSRTCTCRRSTSGVAARRLLRALWRRLPVRHADRAACDTAARAIDRRRRRARPARLGAQALRPRARRPRRPRRATAIRPSSASSGSACASRATAPSASSASASPTAAAAWRASVDDARRARLARARRRERARRLPRGRRARAPRRRARRAPAGAVAPAGQRGAAARARPLHRRARGAGARGARRRSGGAPRGGSTGGCGCRRCYIAEGRCATEPIGAGTLLAQLEPALVAAEARRRQGELAWSPRRRAALGYVWFRSRGFLWRGACRVCGDTGEAVAISLVASPLLAASSLLMSLGAALARAAVDGIFATYRAARLEGRDLRAGGLVALCLAAAALPYAVAALWLRDQGFRHGDFAWLLGARATVLAVEIGLGAWTAPITSRRRVHVPGALNVARGARRRGRHPARARARRARRLRRRRGAHAARARRHAAARRVAHGARRAVPPPTTRRGRCSRRAAIGGARRRWRRTTRPRRCWRRSACVTAWCGRCSRSSSSRSCCGTRRCGRSARFYLDVRRALTRREEWAAAAFVARALALGVVVAAVWTLAWMTAALAAHAGAGAVLLRRVARRGGGRRASGGPA